MFSKSNLTFKEVQKEDNETSSSNCGGVTLRPLRVPGPPLLEPNCCQHQDLHHLEAFMVSLYSYATEAVRTGVPFPSCIFFHIFCHE